MLEQYLVDGGATALIVYLILDLRRRVNRLEVLINGR